MKITLPIIAAVFVLIMSACGTSRPSASEAQGAAGSARVSTKAEQTADHYRIVDWKDRSIGEIASPVWLFPAVRGNWNLFKSEWPVASGKVLKIGVARHATLNGAQTVADVQYAARLANQLKQQVLTRAGISMGSDGEFDVLNNAVTQAQVTMAGQERVTDFWQLVETTNADGRKTAGYKDTADHRRNV